MMRHAASLSLVLSGLAWLGPAPAGLSAREPPAPEPAVEIPQDLQPPEGNAPVGVGAALDRYDGHGYPQDASGLLAVSRDPEGYLVTLRDDPYPWLLYAQFVNRQRDAVLLAREEDLHDVLPSGEPVAIPYGSGALKTNALYVSVVEGQLLPHFSDNRKEYEYFPLEDWYLAAAVGFSGLTAGFQYVRSERWVGYGMIGMSLLGAFRAPLFAPFNHYAMPLHLGGGRRFPGLLEHLIGDNHWTVGGDLLLGLGDLDLDPQTPGAVWMPGVFFEVEKSRPAPRRPPGGASGPVDYREDPRPYNYLLQALYLRLALHLNPRNAAEAGLLKLNLSVGYRTSIAGPRIPARPFKETAVVYIHDDYRRQILQQRERRSERIRRQAARGGP